MDHDNGSCCGDWSEYSLSQYGMDSLAVKFVLESDGSGIKDCFEP